MTPPGGGKPGKGRKGAGRKPGRGPAKPRGSAGRKGGRGAGSTQPRYERERAEERPPRGDRERWGGARGGEHRAGRPGGGERGTPRGPRLRADGGRVCVIRRSGRVTVAEPFFTPGDRHVVQQGTADEGTLALVIPRPDGALEIAEQLGDPEIALDVIAALLRERDMAPRHRDEVLAAAGEAVRAPDPAPQRRDLRAVPTFTIDPATAKDFDDAISAERHPGGGALIRVHIADVTSFLPADGVVDRAGRERATSTYVPGLVAPMLPPQLADDACSLVPGADRRAVTVEMLVREGRCLNAEVYRSLIRSDARLTYEEVDEIFERRAEPGPIYAEPLAVARDVAAALLLARPQALELDIPEPQFSFAPNGAVTGQRPSQNTESHKLIEQLMVLANEQVARILEAAGAPGLFRVHERPEPASARRLVEQLRSLGVPAPALPDELTIEQATQVVAECSREVAEVVRLTGKGRGALPVLVLRALKVAAYDPVCRGHAGLGLRHYCHFTSPIRRYPDIVCHRAVLALAELGLARIDADAPEPAPGDAPGDEDPLSQLGKHCSERERDSMGVEREADRIAKAFLLRDRLQQGRHGETWRGEVTGMVPAGLFVSFGGGFDGMIPLRSLKGDWWELNPEGTAFYAERSGAMVRLGDDAEVMVDKVDVVRGRVDLLPLAIAGNLDDEPQGGRRSREPDRRAPARDARDGDGDRRARHRGRPRRER